MVKTLCSKNFYQCMLADGVARKTCMDLAKIRDILSMGYKEYLVHMTSISEGVTGPIIYIIFCFSKRLLSALGI